MMNCIPIFNIFLGKITQALIGISTNGGKQRKKIEDLDENMKNIESSLEQIAKKDKLIMSTTVNNIAGELELVKNR